MGCGLYPGATRAEGGADGVGGVSDAAIHGQAATLADLVDLLHSHHRILTRLHGRQRQRAQQWLARGSIHHL